MSSLKFEKWQNLDGVTRNAVLQIETKEVRNSTSNAGTSYVDATQMFLAITPTSATSKILVSFNVGYRVGASVNNTYMAMRLLRDSTAIYEPYVNNGTGHYAFGIAVGGATSNILRASTTLETLDSPSTTNEVVYKLQFRLYLTGTSAICYINEGCTSSITLMEIAQ
jgi:hypothetical protein